MATPSLDWNAAFAAQHPRLVRLHMLLTGSPDVADDLAQETLLEAWRSMHKLHDAAGLSQWLNAIARNVFLRWKRLNAQHANRIAGPLDDEIIETNETLISAEDLTRDLERDDLALLLERALVLLPSQTRYLLMASHLRGIPQAELAQQSGLSESAVRMRLHRSRAKLREILEPALGDDPDPALYAEPADEHPLPRWCPFCGKRRLVYRYSGDAIEFRCSGPCAAWPGQLARTSKVPLTDPAVVLDTLLNECHSFYRQGLESGKVICQGCGRPCEIWTIPPDGLENWALLRDHRHIFILCPCGMQDITPLWHLTLDLPQIHRFWLAHPQIHALPEQPLEYQGQPALLTSFASLTDARRVDIICDATTYAPLDMFTRGLTASSTT